MLPEADCLCGKYRMQPHQSTFSDPVKQPRAGFEYHRRDGCGFKPLSDAARALHAKALWAPPPTPPAKEEG